MGKPKRKTSRLQNRGRGKGRGKTSVRRNVARTAAKKKSQTRTRTRTRNRNAAKTRTKKMKTMRGGVTPGGNKLITLFDNYDINSLKGMMESMKYAFVKVTKKSDTIYLVMKGNDQSSDDYETITEITRYTGRNLSQTTPTYNFSLGGTVYVNKTLDGISKIVEFKGYEIILKQTMEDYEQKKFEFYHTMWLLNYLPQYSKDNKTSVCLISISPEFGKYYLCYTTPVTDDKYKVNNIEITLRHLRNIEAKYKIVNYERKEQDKMVKIKITATTIKGLLTKFSEQLQKTTKLSHQPGTFGQTKILEVTDLDPNRISITLEENKIMKSLISHDELQKLKEGLFPEKTKDERRCMDVDCIHEIQAYVFSSALVPLNTWVLLESKGYITLVYKDHMASPAIEGSDISNIKRIHNHIKKYKKKKYTKETAIKIENAIKKQVEENQKIKEKMQSNKSPSNVKGWTDLRQNEGPRTTVEPTYDTVHHRGIGSAAAESVYDAHGDAAAGASPYESTSGTTQQTQQSLYEVLHPNEGEHAPRPLILSNQPYSADTALVREVVTPGGDDGYEPMSPNVGDDTQPISTTGKNTGPVPGEVVYSPDPTVDTQPISTTGKNKEPVYSAIDHSAGRTRAGLTRAGLTRAGLTPSLPPRADASAAAHQELSPYAELQLSPRPSSEVSEYQNLNPDGTPRVPQGFSPNLNLPSAPPVSVATQHPASTGVYQNVKHRCKYLNEKKEQCVNYQEFKSCVRHRCTTPKCFEPKKVNNNLCIKCLKEKSEIYDKSKGFTGLPPMQDFEGFGQTHVQLGENKPLQITSDEAKEKLRSAPGLVSILGNEGIFLIRKSVNNCDSNKYEECYAMSIIRSDKEVFHLRIVKRKKIPNFVVEKPKLKKLIDTKETILYDAVKEIVSNTNSGLGIYIDKKIITSLREYDPNPLISKSNTEGFEGFDSVSMAGGGYKKTTKKHNKNKKSVGKKGKKSKTGKNTFKKSVGKNSKKTRKKHSKKSKTGKNTFFKSVGKNSKKTRKKRIK